MGTVKMQVKGFCFIFDVMLWHTGRYVAVNLDGYNWRIDGNKSNELDNIISALENDRGIDLTEDESGVIISNGWFGGIRIITVNREIVKGYNPYQGKNVRLNSDQKAEFLAILKIAAARKINIPMP